MAEGIELLAHASVQYLPVELSASVNFYYYDFFKQDATYKNTYYTCTCAQEENVTASEHRTRNLSIIMRYCYVPMR